MKGRRDILDNPDIKIALIQ